MRAWRAWILLLFAAGCGHSMPKDAPPSYRFVELMKKDYRLGNGCGNGPFAIALELPPVHAMSRLRVYSVGKQALPMRFDVNTNAFTTWLHAAPPDDRCHLRSGEVVAIAPIAPSAAASKKSAKPEHVLPLAPPPEIVVQSGLEALAVPAVGPTFLQGSAYLTDGENRNIPDLAREDSCWSLKRPPKALQLKMWLTSVQHLDEIALRVVVEEIVPAGSPAEFEQRVAKRISQDRALAAARAADCTAHPDDLRCFVGCERANAKTGVGSWKPVGPPPPMPPVETPPPQPRPDAEWIAGSWRYSGTKYEWDSGFWRLPEPPPAPPPPVVKVAIGTQPHPVAAALRPVAPPPIVHPPAPIVHPPPLPIVQAVPPPPPPIVEAVPPPPIAAVLWVPGYWSWSGRTWVWVAGAWRVPPHPTARFVPPRILIAPSGVIFDPGRWVQAPR